MKGRKGGEKQLDLQANSAAPLGVAAAAFSQAVRLAGRDALRDRPSKFLESSPFSQSLQILAKLTSVVPCYCLPRAPPAPPPAPAVGARLPA